MDIQVYIEKLINWATISGVQILIILVVTFIALMAVKVFSKHLVSLLVKKKDDEEFFKRTQTFSTIVRYVLDIAILFVAVILILKEFGVDFGPILAAAGIAGLAIGFGAQSLVKDVISGLFILIEDQIRVGDVIQISGKSGVVEQISLRTTTLRDLGGNVHYVPNGQIDSVTNMTKEYSRYVFDIGVAYREDADEVMNVIKEVDEELRKDPAFKDEILEPIEVLGLDEFADSALIIKARTTTKPIKQWYVGREFKRRLKKKFDEKGIEIPFPHITLYMGQDKQGQSPPVHVSLENTNRTKKGNA
jgi:small conductance mechanosensitive channel